MSTQKTVINTNRLYEDSEEVPEFDWHEQRLRLEQQLLMRNEQLSN